MRVQRADPSAGAQGLVGVATVAALFGVRQRWVYEHKDEIPHYVVGRYLRFSLPELLAWLARNRQGPSTDKDIQEVIGAQITGFPARTDAGRADLAPRK